MLVDYDVRDYKTVHTPLNVLLNRFLLSLPFVVPIEQLVELHDKLSIISL